MYWEFKGGSRHKEHHHEERGIFFIRHFSNCSTLHHNALAARAACLDLRLELIWLTGKQGHLNNQMMQCRFEILWLSLVSWRQQFPGNEEQLKIIVRNVISTFECYMILNYLATLTKRERKKSLVSLLIQELKFKICFFLFFVFCFIIIIYPASSVLLNFYQWGSCLPCETPTNEPCRTSSD